MFCIRFKSSDIIITPLFSLLYFFFPFLVHILLKIILKFLFKPRKTKKFHAGFKRFLDDFVFLFLVFFLLEFYTLWAILPPLLQSPSALPDPELGTYLRSCTPVLSRSLSTASIYIFLGRSRGLLSDGFQPLQPFFFPCIIVLRIYVPKPFDFRCPNTKYMTRITNY